MTLDELLSRLAIALGIGLLLGIERGWRTREHEAGSRAAGIRTFTVSALLGSVCGALGQVLGGIAGGLIVGLGLMSYSALMGLFCIEENRADKSHSATTWVAATLAFALGTYAVIGNPTAAAALAVAATIILALREPIHGWVARLTWSELRSALVLLAMTFIALPIMPADPIGPFGGFNPRAVWITAIVLAAVSFTGYAAVKYFGAHLGILLAGFAGGLASSTAVTIANARRAAAGEGSPALLAAGVAMASAVMFLRCGAIVLAVNSDLIALVAPPLVAAAAAAAGLAGAIVFWRQSDKDNSQQTEFNNPFSFWSVVGFAIFLGVVIVVGRAVGETFGAAGAIAGAAVLGLVDVDAITVSTARLAPEPLSAADAAAAILAAVTTSTVGKVAIGAMAGSGRFALENAGIALACLAAGAAAAWLTFSIMG